MESCVVSGQVTISDEGGKGLIDVLGSIDAEREFFLSDKKTINLGSGETKEVVFDFPVDRFADKKCQVVANVP